MGLYEKEPDWSSQPDPEESAGPLLVCLSLWITIFVILPLLLWVWGVL